MTFVAARPDAPQAASTSCIHQIKSTMKQTTKTNILASLYFVIFAQFASAAVVSFSFAELAQDGSNVAANGTVHTSIAYGGGNPDPRIINGVNWNTLVPGRSDNPLFGFANNRNAASTYYGIAGTALKETTNDIVFNNSMTLGINQLTIGQEYRLQFISFDALVAGTAADLRSRLQFVAPTGDNTGDLVFNQFFVNGGAGLQDMRAALVTATWVADATEIDFLMQPIGSNDNAILNAFVVQAIPEPSSAVLLGLGGLAFVTRRRRK